MNSDLEKLVDYAIADGYINEKEKEVLIKKAQVQGFDLDELAIILQGRLNETKGTYAPDLDKCPNCGDTITGISKICPSCDYVSDSARANIIENYNEELKELTENCFELKVAKDPGASKVVKAVIFTVITAGLYFVYKKLIKKQNLFDRYECVNETIGSRIDWQILALKKKYGNDENVNIHITAIDTDRKRIVKKRQQADGVVAVITFIVIGIIIYFLPAISKIKLPEKVETVEERVERLVNAKQISKAKITVDSLEQGENKNELVAMIRILEIDSLTDVHNYYTALSQARFIKNTSYNKEMEDKVDEILEKQINYLIANKEFKLAKEQAEMASDLKKDYFITSIEVEEYLEKNKKAIEQKNAPVKKRKRKR